MKLILQDLSELHPNLSSVKIVQMQSTFCPKCPKSKEIGEMFCEDCLQKRDEENLIMDRFI